MRKTIPFQDLSESDLLIDAAYAGGSRGNVADDPIDKLVGVGNQGGFRYLGSPRNNTLKLCVLYSELSDPDWPDELNPESGTFVYYGDNKRPGHELHETRRSGNLILRNAFEDLHYGRRTEIPPFFIFTKGAAGRDVIFRGLAVPGAISIPQTEDHARLGTELAKRVAGQARQTAARVSLQRGR
jgi:AspBHI-like restriction endonuclease